MFHPRASARSRAVALAVVFCIAGCATARTGTSVGNTHPPLAEPPGLTPAEETRAHALAEYADGVSEEFRGDFDSALQHYQQVLQLDPHQTALAVRLGQIYATKHDITNAVSVLQTSAAANPNDAEVLYWLGFIYRSDSQNDKAATAFRQALKISPTNVGALGGLLDLYILQDSVTEAAKLLDRAFHEKTEVSNYWVRLGDFYTVVWRQKPTWASKVDHKRIQQCYEKALTLGPVDPDVQMRLADSYTDSAEYQKAADCYLKLLAKNPDAPLIRERLAANYIRAEQKEKAIAVLEEIIKREPLAYTVYNYLGELYAELGRTDKGVDLAKTERAISNYQQSLVVRPDQPENYAQITALQLDCKQIDQALQTIGTWKEKFPTDFRVPYFTGLIQTDRKQYPAAVTSFADAESLAHESPDGTKLSSSFYFSYAAASERAGSPDKAVTLFRKCLQIDPDDHTACNYLGYMWAEKGTNLDEAFSLIQRAVKLDPGNGAYMDSLGWVLFKLGRYDEALPQLRHATDLITDDPVVFDHLAEVLLKLGKTEEAINVLRRASKLEPDNKEISEKLQKLESNQSSAH